MDIKSNVRATGRPIGQASTLKRYGAKLANHKNYSRREFISTLSDCHQMLDIEMRTRVPEKLVNENGEEIEEPITKIDWQPLECPKCHRQFNNTQLLLTHLVSQHGKPCDKDWFQKFRTVSTDLNKVFEAGVAKQFENSHVKRKFNNSNDLLLCPADSPLAPFIMMRHLQVYFQELPPTVTDGISLKLQNGDTLVTVIFSFQKIDKVRRRIKRAMAKKALQVQFKKLESKCEPNQIEFEDVCSKTDSNSEEFQALAKAFNLPSTCSHAEIMEKINEIRERHEEMNPFCSSVYNKNVKPNGQMMSKEERRLISSLTNDMVTPVSGKRKTTYKNPSESTTAKKGRLQSSQKTSSPA
ncbi:unnamed protein product [Caenorhabditis brenneri]